MNLTKDKETFRKRYFEVFKEVTSIILELSKEMSREKGIELQSIQTIYEKFLKDIFFDLYRDYP